MRSSSVWLSLHFAGAIDAAVGGGGLIQIPAIMGSLPHLQPATVFGTNKLASICGTASAAFSYLRQVKLPWLLLGVIALCSFVSSFIGAASVTLIPVEILKPFVLVMLIVIAIYTLMKKQFGQVHTEQKLNRKMLILAALGSLAIGFYDGIFGRALAVSLFSFYSLFKRRLPACIGLIENCQFHHQPGRLKLFIPSGNVLFMVGAMMAVANICGSLVGVRLAFKYGSGFIRILFLILVSLLICRMAYQMFLDINPM